MSGDNLSITATAGLANGGGDGESVISDITAATDGEVLDDDSVISDITAATAGNGSDISVPKIITSSKT